MFEFEDLHRHCSFVFYMVANIMYVKYKIGKCPKMWNVNKVTIFRLCNVSLYFKLYLWKTVNIYHSLWFPLEKKLNVIKICVLQILFINYKMDFVLWHYHWHIKNINPQGNHSSAYKYFLVIPRHVRFHELASASCVRKLKCRL